MNRRNLLSFFGVGGAAFLAPVISKQLFAQAPLGTPLEKADTYGDVDNIEIPTKPEDRIFRRAFTRALRRLRLKGALPRARFKEIRSATFNTFAYSRNGRRGTFLQHVRRDVEEQAGGAFDDMFAAAQMFMEALVQWIVESWNALVKNVMGNLEAMTIALDTE